MCVQMHVRVQMHVCVQMHACECVYEGQWLMGYSLSLAALFLRQGLSRSLELAGLTTAVTEILLSLSSQCLDYRHELSCLTSL